MGRMRLYEVLDIIAVFAACIFVGAKAGRIKMRRYIKQAKHI